MNMIKLTHRDITYYINVSKIIHIESYYEINFVDEKYAIDIVLSHDVIKLRYNNEKYSGITSSQLRQFYGEVKALQSKMGKNGEDFIKVYPFILMLKSKASYKANRENSKLPEAFKIFIEKNVELVQKANKEGKGYETFNNFALFYEVVIGFFKGATK